MSLDGIVIRALVHELQPYVGARLHKIYQPTGQELVLHMRGQGVAGRLLLSAHPSMPRLHFTGQPWDNPAEPPMFCMLLRKHMEGGVIEDIRQLGLERIVEFDVRHRDELGDYSLKRLTLEIMGRHSNLILLDPATGVIHDGIRHVSPAMSSHRVVLPGAAYVAPPSQNKRDPLSENEAEFYEAGLAAGLSAGSVASSASSATDGGSGLEEAVRFLSGAYTGMSALLAREIAFRAGDGGRCTLSALWKSFRTVMADAAEHRYEPCTVEDESGKTAFSAVALTHLDGERRTFTTTQQCVETFYQGKAERDLVRQRTTDLHRFLINEISKNEKKLLKLAETLEDAADADRFRRLGELLTAHLHEISRGDRVANVIDYYDEMQPVVEVELDPLLTGNENAQRYFRKYNKLKNSRVVVQEQIDATRTEIGYLQSVLQGLESASPRDIEEIREELIEEGYIRARGQKRGAKKKKKDVPAVLCYTSSEGVPIYVGKNNTQNDYVTNKLATPNDTWLHTKDIPGSHVLIRSTEFGETTLLEAALLAAYYSKARESGGVPVDYTRIRHVRKPNGAKPGFVIYDNQKTLYVTPDETLVARMPCVVK